MGDRRAALLLLLTALGGGRTAAQVFPNDQTPRAAFPATVTLFVFGGFEGARVTRIYNIGTPNPVDAACDSTANDCRTIHGLGGASGIGVRGQVTLTMRTGLRLGITVAHPGRRVSTREGSQVSVPDESVLLLRAEGMVLFRLKPQVPVFFGLGVGAASDSPGPVRAQEAVTEVGGMLAIGVDHHVSPTVATRVEFTGFVMRPTASGLSTEFHAHSLTFDDQLSLGFNFLFR